MGLLSRMGRAATALSKYYYPFTWRNKPSIESPINEVHLNHIEDGINEMDNRILILATDKADAADLTNVFIDFDIDDTTGIMTFTRFDGTTKSRDTPMEKIILNCYLEDDNFVLVLADGTKQKVSLAKFIDTYTFTSSDTIRFSVNGKNITADIPDGKITLAKLEPTIMSTIRKYTLDAQTAQGVAEQAASTAQGWAIGGTGFEDNNAKHYASRSQRYAVGGVEEGDTEDNAKYYYQQAQAAAEQATGAAGFDGTASTVSAIDTQGVAVRKASGTGHVTITDAAEHPILNLDLTGKSEQVVTTGAQLFNAYNLSLNNATATITESGRVIKAVGKNTSASNLYANIDISKVAGKTVYLQGDQISKDNGTIQMQLRVKKADGTYRYATSTDAVESNIKLSLDINSDDTELVLFLYCRSASDLDNVSIFENVRVGIAESAWEPYTGGKPSPSPEYPQPIISTGTVSTGAQLFDVNTIQSTQGVTWSASDDSRRITVTGSNAYARAYCEVPIKSVQGQTVTLSGTITSQSNPSGVVKCQIVITNAQDVMQYYPLVDNHVTVAVPVDSKRLEVGLFVNNGGAALNPANTVIFSDIMLNAGTTALPWEPYTGGKPSPSPEYPQPLDVTVTGEQLLDLKTRIGSQSQNGITLTVNADGSVAVSGTATSDATFILSSSSHMSLDVGKDYAIRGYGTDFDNNFFWQCWTKEPSGVFKDTGLGATFLYTQESEFNFAVLVKSGKTVNATFWPMLNEGTSPKPWQPYQSCTATITLTEPLHGIGDVRDRIMCRDGVWGIERQTAQIILNGSENWIVSNTGYANKNRFWYGGYENVIKHENDPDVAIKILCDKLTGEASGDTYRCTDGISSNVAGRIMVYIDDCSAGGADSFKVYLASNPITAIFERATPTWEPLPSDTQSALNALTTYTGTTHVTITAGGPEPDVGLEYFGQPGDKVTVQDMCDSFAAPGFDDSGDVQGISGFGDFLNRMTSGMRLPSFFRDLKAGLKFVLHTGQLVNNGLCNEPGKYPLDAAYGRTLLEMIGNTANLPGGAADIVSAIVTQNSNFIIISNKGNVNTDWATGSANYQLMGKMCIVNALVSIKNTISIDGTLLIDGLPVSSSVITKLIHGTSGYGVFVLNGESLLVNVSPGAVSTAIFYFTLVYFIK